MTTSLSILAKFFKGAFADSQAPIRLEFSEKDAAVTVVDVEYGYNFDLQALRLKGKVDG